MVKRLVISDDCFYTKVSKKQFKKVLYLLKQIHNRKKIDSIFIQIKENGYID